MFLLDNFYLDFVLRSLNVIVIAFALAAPVRMVLRVIDVRRTSTTVLVTGVKTTQRASMKSTLILVLVHRDSRVKKSPMLFH